MSRTGFRYAANRDAPCTDLYDMVLEQVGMGPHIILACCYRGGYSPTGQRSASTVTSIKCHESRQRRASQHPLKAAGSTTAADSSKHPPDSTPLARIVRRDVLEALQPHSSSTACCQQLTKCCSGSADQLIRAAQGVQVSPAQQAQQQAHIWQQQQQGQQRTDCTDSSDRLSLIASSTNHQQQQQQHQT